MALTINDEDGQNDDSMPIVENISVGKNEEITIAMNEITKSRDSFDDTKHKPISIQKTRL